MLKKETLKLTRLVRFSILDIFVAANVTFTPPTRLVYIPAARQRKLSMAGGEKLSCRCITVVYILHGNNVASGCAKSASRCRTDRTFSESCVSVADWLLKSCWAKTASALTIALRASACRHKDKTLGEHKRLSKGKFLSRSIDSLRVFLRSTALISQRRLPKQISVNTPPSWRCGSFLWAPGFLLSWSLGRRWLASAAPERVRFFLAFRSCDSNLWPFHWLISTFVLAVLPLAQASGSTVIETSGSSLSVKENDYKVSKCKPTNYNVTGKNSSIYATCLRINFVSVFNQDKTILTMQGTFSKCSAMFLYHRHIEVKCTCLPGYSSIGDDVQLPGRVLELGVRKNV